MLGYHTLDARDSTLLPWLYTQVADSDPKVFQALMQKESDTIRALLRSRGVNYDNLKSALQPTDHGRQIVFLYDWWEDDATNYAVEFAQHYLPLLRPTLHTSLLHGDLLALHGRSTLRDELQRQHVSRRHGLATDLSLVTPVRWSTLYAVYFNNLTPSDVTSLHNQLCAVPRYRGYVDVSYGGPVRDYLASTLIPGMVISGRHAIVAHDDLDALISNKDPMGFNFPEHGYDTVGLNGEYFHALLAYKIEVTRSPSENLDRFLLLAALTGHAIDVDQVPIIVPPEKLTGYLLSKEDKLRRMTDVGLQDVTPPQLAHIIRDKLAHSYIYNLEYAIDGTPKFAVTAEFITPDGAPTRRLIALKYDAHPGTINLVSMY